MSRPPHRDRNRAAVSRKFKAASKPLKPWTVRVRVSGVVVEIEVWTLTRQAAIEATMSSESCPRADVLSVVPSVR